ncbi:hypothetical protein LY44_02985 [Rhodobacter capsulatus]|nr:hypothetical protein [Rhodobacter capsulatus]PZX22257.1 hypothetical protein LY44_02985 [Rhodobacter capsulatus]
MALAYGEFAYFHDFVQRALFGKTGGPGAGPLRLFQRSDIRAADVKFFDWTAPRRFAVERLNLYLLSGGIAVVALQCRAEAAADLNLKDVLRFNESMRRSHIPYFANHNTTIGPRGLPDSVAWHLQDGTSCAFLPSDEGVEFRSVPAEAAPPSERKHVRTRTPYSTLLETPPEDRRILPARHWRWLLNGDEENTERMPLCAARGGFRWRHLSDDRLPLMTTVILRSRADYYALSDGHWMRLAFVEQPGKSPFPYAEAFLRNGFEGHCYDRFHHAKELEENGKPVPCTRYLMCDYAMTAVTYAEGNDYAETLEVHMQRHYYQMFLLQVIDKAMMLGLSSRITRAVARFDRTRSEPALSTGLQDIERDFLHYVHRFRFTGVSGQLQAGELYARLRGVMRLDAMFADIKSELETAVAFLSSREAERQGREARHATEAAERLNIIASLGVVIALVMGFFSMNILSTESLIEGLFKMPSPSDKPIMHVTTFGFGLLAAAGLAWILSHAIAVRTGTDHRRIRPAEAFVRRGLAVLFFLGAALASVAVWPR